MHFLYTLLLKHLELQDTAALWYYVLFFEVCWGCILTALGRILVDDWYILLRQLLLVPLYRRASLFAAIHSLWALYPFLITRPIILLLWRLRSRVLWLRIAFPIVIILLLRLFLIGFLILLVPFINRICGCLFLLALCVFWGTLLLNDGWYLLGYGRHLLDLLLGLWKVVCVVLVLWLWTLCATLCTDIWALPQEFSLLSCFRFIFLSNSFLLSLFL